MNPHDFLKTSDFAAYANTGSGAIVLTVPPTVTVAGSGSGVVLQSTATFGKAGSSFRACISSDAYPGINVPSNKFLVPTRQDGGTEVIYQVGLIYRTGSNTYAIKVSYPPTGDGQSHTYTNLVGEITAKIITFDPV